MFRCCNNRVQYAYFRIAECGTHSRTSTGTPIRYGTTIYGRIAGVRILYGRIICGRRIFFELQYGTSTVQSYKFEYSTSKRRGLISTVRYRSLVNLQQDKSTGTVFVRKRVRYATRRVRSMKKRVRYVRVHSSYWPHGGVESYCAVLLQYEHSSEYE